LNSNGNEGGKLTQLTKKTDKEPKKIQLKLNKYSKSCWGLRLIN